MKLEFLYAPVQKIDEALAVYRDGLGLTEAWREGENTVTLNLPDSDVKLMLDAEAPAAKPGPLFVVEQRCDLPGGASQPELRRKSGDSWGLADLVHGSLGQRRLPDGSVDGRHSIACHLTDRPWTRLTAWGARLFLPVASDAQMRRAPVSNISHGLESRGARDQVAEKYENPSSVSFARPGCPGNRWS